MGRKWVWFFAPAAATTSLFIAVAAFSEEGGDRALFAPAATTTTQPAQTTRQRRAQRRTPTAASARSAMTTTTTRLTTTEPTTTAARTRTGGEVISEDFESSETIRLPPASKRQQTTTTVPPATAPNAREQTTTAPPATPTTTAASRTQKAAAAASATSSRRRRTRAERASPGRRARLVRVPDLLGLSTDQAVAQLRRHGFRAKARRERSFAPDGTVFEQEPLAGRRIRPGRTVLFTVSFFKARRPPPPPPAPPVSALPRLIGLDYWEAAARAELRGLVANSYPVRARLRADHVVGQTPAPGTRVRKGSRIQITVSVSKERAPRPVPHTLGLTELTAHARCRDEHFTCRTMLIPATQASEVGRVLRQKPNAGDLEPELTQIKLFVGE
jgi:PASTA domain